MNVAKIILCSAVIAVGLLLLSRPRAAASPLPQAAQHAAASDSVPPLVVTPRMRRYARTGYALYFAGTLYGWALLWGVLASGGSARLRNVAERAVKNPWARLAVYYGLLTAGLALAQFPLAWYGGFWRERAYGLSAQSFGAWLGDWLKGEAVTWAISVLLIRLVLWLIQRSPRRWPLWLWGASVPIVAFGIFLAPLVIDPLFNKFTPLPPGPLRVRIEQLAAQAGIPHAPIYVVDKSRQTRTTNAYVTGLGASARIVIWDTTLQQLPSDEVVGIVGHEMGHYVLKHIPWGFAETLAGLLVLLPLTASVAGWTLAKRGARWGLRGMTDLAAVPVLLLTVSALGFLADPITNGLSRRMEHQADAYGLAATHNGPALARAFVYFASHDLSDPNPPPLVKFWLFSHPPIGERINFVLGRKNVPPYGT